MRQSSLKRAVGFWLHIATELLAPCSEFSLWFLAQVILALFKLPFFGLLLLWEYKHVILQAAYMLLHWLLWDTTAPASPLTALPAPPANNSNITEASKTSTAPQHGECMSVSALASVFVLPGLNAKV